MTAPGALKVHGVGADVSCVDPRLMERLRPEALDLPLLPDAVARIMSAAENPDINARQLAELIERDPGVTGHVLRIANSAGYAVATRVTSLAQAVSRLGMKAIAEIALVVSCQTRVFRAGAAENDVRAAFAHSFAAAMFAREIARAQRAGVEEAFLAGLFHDVGRPILCELLVELGEPKENREAIIVQLHAEVGAAMVDKWQLGARLSDVVRRHHAAPDSPLLATVQLADALAHAALQPDGDLAAVAKHPARVFLNLYDQQLAKLVGCSEAIVTAVGAIA